MFVTDILNYVLENNARCVADCKSNIISKHQTTTVRSHQLDTSELCELLQQSAVEYLTLFRHFEARELRSVAAIVATDFEALYAYKCGDYQRCLHLSMHSVLTLICEASFKLSICVYILPEFIQLMDEDIVSLTGLTLLVIPSCTKDIKHVAISQLILSLYLMTQCQLKLHQSVTDLIPTLVSIDVACRGCNDPVSTLEQLLLKLTERKILKYITAVPT